LQKFLPALLICRPCRGTSLSFSIIRELCVPVLSHHLCPRDLDAASHASCRFACGSICEFRFRNAGRRRNLLCSGAPYLPLLADMGFLVSHHSSMLPFKLVY